MSAPPDGGRVLVDFFDDQQASSKYEALKARTKLIDMKAAEVLNSGVAGNVLSIGGVWDYFEWRSGLKAMTVVDVSRKMLDAYAPPKAVKVLGDFYQSDFGRGDN
jgi:hypothetical protein